MSLVSPFTLAWACALIFMGKEIPRHGRVSALANDDIDTICVVSETEITQLPPNLSDEERALLIFAIMLRTFGPGAPVMEYTDFTHHDRDALNTGFAEIFLNALDPVFIRKTDRTHPLVLNTDHSEGTRWWTAPSEVTFEPHSIERGALMSSRFREDFTVLGGVPTTLVLSDTSPLDVLYRVHYWKEMVNTQHAALQFTLQLPEHILRINHAAQFIELTERYPQEVTSTLRYNVQDWDYFGYDVLPNWQTLATIYTGVMLSARAFIESSWAFLPTRYGNTKISGWKPECIYFLRDP